MSKRTKLELAITQAWQNQSAWLKLLSPLSALFAAASGAHKALYKKGISSSYKAAVPVLVIGNITVGGSGKTPLIIALVEYLQSKNIKVGVISRGYRAKSQNADKSTTARLVGCDSTPDEVGDEPCLIVQSTGVPMAVSSNRGAAIELLLAHYPLDLIISDDGLQHHALARDDEWIVVDVARGFGNEKLLPQGFLREPIQRLEGATVIYHDRDISQDKLSMTLQPSALEPLLTDTPSSPPTDAVYAISGIGYPKRFFATLTQLGFAVDERAFGDHHDFSLDDLIDLTDKAIITTSKDAVKLRTLARQNPHPIFNNIWVLPVKAKLSAPVYRAMDDFVAKFCTLTD